MRDAEFVADRNPIAQCVRPGHRHDVVSYGHKDVETPNECADYRHVFYCVHIRFEAPAGR